MRGRFLTLEGVEGTGKSTQLAFVIDYLEKHNKTVIATREPGGTELGEKIRSLLLSNDLPSMDIETELTLMYAARNEHIKKVIQPALNAGKWVVSDRYVDASYVYQGYGRGVALAQIDTLNKLIVKDCMPDVTILLDLSLEVSAQRVQDRGAKDRFENEAQQFYEKVRQGYLSLAKDNPQRIKQVDASQTIAQVQDDISKILDAFMLESDSHA